MKMFLVILVVVSLVIVFSAPAFANGKPAAHGLSGAEFGEAVAENAPIADHASENANGKPAAHGLSGYAFGQLVAESAPINEHVKP